MPARILFLLSLGINFIAFLSCRPPVLHEIIQVSSSLQLESSSIDSSGNLARRCTCDGASLSPALHWKNIPAGTKSFAVTMHHIPGPGDRHEYMIVYNIPANTESLAEGETATGTWGINTVNGKRNYAPPCSKGPGPKDYIITVYALAETPVISTAPDRVTMDVLLESISQITLGTASITGTYSR